MMVHELFLLEPDFDELGCCDSSIITGVAAYLPGRLRTGDDEIFPFD
jgi:hypothetical protein